MSRRFRAASAGGALMLLVAGCIAEPTPTALPTPAPTASPTASPSPDATAGATDPPSPTATPEPALSLDLPEGRDERRVGVSVAVDVPAEDDGRIVVTVTSAADSMIDELVLRWPADLHETLFPAPFEPSPGRIDNAAPPLVQPWTKWVLGPGERGEPAGTVSLGWGPLLAGGTLEIELFVTRHAPGAVAFDLQLLAGEELLALDDGEPAELRIEVP